MFWSYRKNADLRQKAQILYSTGNTYKPENNLETGRYCTILLYGATKDVSLNQMQNIEDLQAFIDQMWYKWFIKGITKSNVVKRSLFPTVEVLMNTLEGVITKYKISKIQI